MTPTRRSLFIFLILVAALLGVIIFGGRHIAPEEEPELPADQATATSTSSIDGSGEQPATPDAPPAGTVGGAGMSVPTSGARTGTTGGTQVPQGTLAALVFPYSDALLSTEYLIGWRAPQGTVATIVLQKGGETVSDISGCTGMSGSGSIAYCSWSQKPLHAKYGTTNFSLVLTVRSANGSSIGTVASSPLTLASRSSVLWEPYADTTYGWSVRRPSGWFVNPEGERTTVSRDAAGLQDPFGSSEAYAIEYCSMAREACTARVESFGAGAASSLAGLSARTRTTSSNGRYVREDMLIRSNIAFFIRRRALTAAGDVLSPFVRESIDTFGFRPARLTVRAYELDESFRAGTLYVEAVNERTTYIRVFTSARTCLIDTDTRTFSEDKERAWRFTNGSCTIEGTLQDDGSYELDEDGCTSLEYGECTFEGRYVPR